MSPTSRYDGSRLRAISAAATLSDVAKRTFTQAQLSAALLASLCVVLSCGKDASGPSSPAPSFTLTIPPSVTVQAGGANVALSISVVAGDGFSGSVAVDLAGLPPGTTTEPSLPVSIAAGATQEIRLRVPSTAEAKQYAVTARGTSGSLSKETATSLLVTAAADFTLTLAPSELNLRAGSSATLSVSMTPRNGLTDSVMVSLSGLPAGATVSPAGPFRVTADSAQEITIAVGATAAPGNYSVSAVGTSTAISRNSTLALAIVPATFTRRSGSRLILDRVEGTDSVVIAVDTTRGGMIAEASLNGRNFLNSAGVDRGVQFTLFSGDAVYDDCGGCQTPSSFNPAQGGDRHGHSAPTIASALGPDYVYIKVRPFDWYPEGKVANPARTEVVVEQWVYAVPLHPRAIRIHYKITYDGSTERPSAPQWLPAVHAVGELDRFTRYAGTSPWTNDGVTVAAANVGAPTEQVLAAEQWGAWTDAQGVGVSLFVPNDYSIFRVKSQGGAGGPLGDGFNRLAPYARLGFRPGTSVETDAYVILGNIDDARRTIYQLHAAATRDVYEPFGFRDQPVSGSTIAGTVTVTGWAVDNLAVSKVEVLVDGRVTGTANYGIPRSDLPTVFPGVTSAGGYDYHLDTRGFADGLHDIAVMITDAAGNQSVWGRANAFFNNGGSGGEPQVDISVGAAEVVMAASTGCQSLDLPDMPARAVRAADGSVIFSAANAPEVYLSFGPTLSSLRRDCSKPALTSPQNPLPQTFDNWYWISSLYRMGDTIHALVHNEYHDPVAQNCLTGDLSPANPCWYNSIIYAYSTDGGHTFQTPPPPNQVVAAPPVVWDPLANGHYGYFGGSNIVHGQDGFYYAMFLAIPSRFDQTSQNTCLMRTKTIGDPASWRAWDGSGFTIRMQSPYQSGVPERACVFVAPSELGGFDASLTYNTYLKQYLLVGVVASGGTCGFAYSLSKDLIHWTRWQLLVNMPVNAGNCAKTPGSLEGSVLYPSLLDPADTSINFENTGRTPYLYYMQWTANSQLQRQLMRVPLTFTLR